MSKQLRNGIRSRKCLKSKLKNNNNMEVGSLVIGTCDRYGITNLYSISEIIQDNIPYARMDIRIKVILHKYSPENVPNIGRAEKPYNTYQVRKKDFRPVGERELKRAVEDWTFWNAPKNNKTSELVKAAIMAAYR